MRYLEIEAKKAEDVYEGRRDSDQIGTPVADMRIVVRNEEELEILLARWLTDFMTLHIPDDVGYWFESGPDLIKGLINRVN